MMKKVKAFFRNFVRSLIPHDNYYSKIIHSPFSHSLGYFLAMIFILNMVFVISIIIKYNPQKINSMMNAFVYELNRYPDDFSINIEKGTMMTNRNRSYLFWLDYDNKKELFFVIDDTADSQKIRMYKSTLLLTPRELVINDKKNNTVSVIPLTYMKSVKITKPLVRELTSTLFAFKQLLPLLSIAFLCIMIVILPFVSLTVMFFYIVITSLIVFAAYRLLARKHIHFRKILQISFHAASLPLLIDYAFTIFKPTIRISTSIIAPPQRLPFPLLFFLLLALFIAAGVYEAYERKNHLIAEVTEKKHHSGQTHKTR